MRLLKPPSLDYTVFELIQDRRRNVLLSTCLACALLFILYTSLATVNSPTVRYGSQTPPPSSSSASQTHSNPLPTNDTVPNFWPTFYTALLEATPRVSLPDKSIQSRPPRHIPFTVTTQERQDLVRLHAEQEAELKDAHTYFVACISSPEFPKPHFIPGSAGIVTSAGGKYWAQALVAIRMLRRTGCKLPVDVYLASPEEDEGNICTAVLPALNARCRVLSTLIDEATGGQHRLTVTHFAIKPFALLLSEFDNTLWLDSDNIALVDPTSFLDSPVLQQTGLVTWPDYWAETISPVYFRVAGIEGDRVPPSTLLPTSESGQLLVSKSANEGMGLKALLLAAYYNFHGPEHYYLLIDQGAWGSGDKDTYAAAAMALEAPHWAIKTPLQTVGWWGMERNAEGDEEEVFHAEGILQACPGVDFEMWGRAVGVGEGNETSGGGSRGSSWRDVDEEVKTRYNVTAFSFAKPLDRLSDARLYFDRVPSAFLHAQQYKPDAGQLSQKWRGKTPRRMWTPHEVMEEAFGFDVERVVWEEIVWTACGEELDGHVFESWNWYEGEGEKKEGRKVDGGKVCERVRGIYGELFGEVEG